MICSAHIHARSIKPHFMRFYEIWYLPNKKKSCYSTCQGTSKYLATITSALGRKRNNINQMITFIGFFCIPLSRMRSEISYYNMNSKLIQLFVILLSGILQWFVLCLLKVHFTASSILCYFIPPNNMTCYLRSLYFVYLKNLFCC